MKHTVSLCVTVNDEYLQTFYGGDITPLIDGVLNRELHNIGATISDVKDITPPLVVVENCYFKVPFGGPALMSGLPMPDPTKGPYHFLRCSFHPGLWETLEAVYAGCKFTDCDGWPR